MDQHEQLWGLPDERPWEGVGSTGEYAPQTSLHREHPCTRDGQSEAPELLLKQMKAERKAFEEEQQPLRGY